MPTPGFSLMEIVEGAARAPSSHNTQPWRFAVRPGEIDVFADRERRLPVNDPHDRELTISCGAALLNARVETARQGRGARSLLLPEAADPDWLATLALSPDLAADEDLAALREAIGSRRTCRGRFSGGEVSADVLAQMRAAIAAEGAVLHVVTGDAKDEVAELVDEADRAQFADAAWRHELATWMRGPSHEDGLPVARVTGHITRWVVRRFDLGPRIGKQDANLVRAAPALLAIGTVEDDVVNWLRAGQALQRSLLLAAHEGLAAGFMNQPCQMRAELRGELAAVLGTDHTPQLIYRLGHPAQSPPPSRRRATADLIVPSHRDAAWRSRR
ncbi:nitroreductase family protein [Nocardioides sp. J2M5]|uniref:Acg family FMN-binding oxidoreductase n=1 Tax=Nocardioides palaemonis TaxID=2829810 RepID=UPI001BADEDF8|nr:nitroreductase family protein [Nocardioides palaemonis]MBS2937022.1 nitroreductase family protein [Nocardioides palaemonis]